MAGRIRDIWGGWLTLRTRAGRSFWLLLAIALLSAGALSSAFRSTPSPGTGLRVAGSGTILVVAVALEIRVMAAVERARRNRGAPTNAP
jgi:hypothetical protein